MRSLFTRLFWGGVLILWGFGIILNELFRVAGEITFAMILVWTGVYLILFKGYEKKPDADKQTKQNTVDVEITLDKDLED